MRCTNCDAALAAGSKFCDACGAKQSAVGALSVPVLKPPPAPAGIPGSTGGLDGSAAVLPADVAAAMSDVSVLGTSEPNAVYLGQRLQYTEGAETFDVGDALSRRTMSQAKFLILIAFLIWFVAAVFSAALIVVSLGSAIALAWLIFIAVLVFNVALVITPFLRRQSFAISEWKLLLDGKGASADAVYDHIAAALVARECPTQYRAVQIPEIWWRGYLQVRMDTYSGFITCFPFGQDLYIGWTLWWSGSWLAYRRANRQEGLLAILKLPFVLVSDMLTGRANTYELAYVHQYDEVKALRECLHAVTRQGVEAAVGVAPLRGRGTIGSTVPEGTSPKFATSPTFGSTVGQRNK